MEPNLERSRVSSLLTHACGMLVMEAYRSLWKFCPLCGVALVWPPPLPPVGPDDHVGRAA